MVMNRKFLRISLLVLVSLLMVAGLMLSAQQQQQPQQIRTPRQTPFPQKPDWAKLEVETLHVQGQVHMIAGAGGNIAVQTGNSSVLMVDTGYEQMAPKVLAAVRKLSSKPLRQIVTTTLSDAHSGGNGVFLKEGFLIDNVGPGVGARPNEAIIIGHSKLLALMAEVGRARVSELRWPSSAYNGKQRDFTSNDEAVVLLHIPNAVTDGDTIVWFRKSDVVATGPLLNMASLPYIDVAHGGTINGILEGLNTLLEITVPRHNQEGGTMVIPGYGRIGDEHDVLEYRDMNTIIRDRVQNAIKKGMTLQQVKALKPSVTYEYEPRYNRDPGWTAEMYVEAIYKNLSVAK
jgi:glyoxylase-like metal-dependent hydrolase (beta-lactamase superfamily II)